MKRRRFVEILRGSLGGGALILAGFATPRKRGVVCLRAKAMQSRFYPGG